MNCVDLKSGYTFAVDNFLIAPPTFEIRGVKVGDAENRERARERERERRGRECREARESDFSASLSIPLWGDSHNQ